MKTIFLNEQEQEFCKSLAKKRYYSNRKSGVENKKIGNQSNEETDLNGIGSEFAVSKFLNIYPDFSIQPRKGGYDLIGSSGSKIDVKTTVHSDGRLLATLKKKDEDIDVYILTTGNFPSYNIVGWVCKDELIKDENIINLGYGPTYALAQDKLNLFS